MVLEIVGVDIVFYVLRCSSVYRLVVLLTIVIKFSFIYDTVDYSYSALVATKS